MYIRPDDNILDRSSFFSQLVKGKKRSFRQLFEIQIRNAAGKYLDDFVEDILLAKNFELQFTKNKTKSLWLFSDDKNAIKALAWCKEHEIDVPNQVSIIAFGNSPICIKSGITSCVYDFDRIGYQMAHAVIRDFPVARTRRGFLRLEGRILERSTTP